MSINTTNEGISVQELVVVKQLPVIEEQLKLASEKFKERTDFAKSLLCTEETVKEVKNIRAGITKDFNALESLRKEVKKKILEPYDKFEAAYKTYITNVYQPSDKDLKKKIDDVESDLKEIKKQEVKDYFDEYILTTDINFLTFEMANINVTLTASLKSLKEQTKAFIDKISDDLILINTQEFKEEILVEYKKNLNVSLAITSVVNRHKEIEAEKVRAEQAKVKQEVVAEAIKKVEAFAPPKVVEQPEQAEFFETTFKVTETIEKLKALKTFLETGGYNYKTE